MLSDMSFEVEFANEAAATFFGGDDDEYEFLPSGVLVVTLKNANAAWYYAPGYWQSVKTPSRYETPATAAIGARPGGTPHPPKDLGKAPFTPPIGD
jgi:hypothetical protein